MPPRLAGDADQHYGEARTGAAGWLRFLVISPKTTNSHVEHIYTEVGVTNRALASLFAAKHGLMPSATDTRHESSKDRFRPVLRFFWHERVTGDQPSPAGLSIAPASRTRRRSSPSSSATPGAIRSRLVGLVRDPGGDPLMLVGIEQTDNLGVDGLGVH